MYMARGLAHRQGQRPGGEELHYISAHKLRYAAREKAIPLAHQ